MKRKVCVLTGTRADYGLLYWLLKELQSDARAELQIIATGMHLSPEFGMTCRFILEDGFTVSEKVEMLLSGDTPTAIAKSLGLGTIGISDALSRLKPDILVILGDRFEALAAAQAAMLARIPIAHLHGGEATEGLIDEAIRHSITKMSHLHFVAAEEYRKRVIQLGERPESVFNVGATGVDNIKRLALYTKEEIAGMIPALKNHNGPIFLITYHPVTLSSRSPVESMRELLSSLDNFSDAKIIITKTNADTFGRQINDIVDEYGKTHPDRVFVSVSLGQKLYLSVLAISDAVIGNSSSGIIEAPAMKIPTVNIGPRQQGRAKAESILDCVESQREITQSIRKALSKDFIDMVKGSKPVYGGGNTSVLIKDILLSHKLDNIIIKKFYDVAGVL
ncbi:MAG: UDP-N-acetylglucosamine 2-epimerase [Bdellovibrio sp.]